MIYDSLTPSFVNKVIQKALRNFGFRLVISLLEKPQSIKSKYLKKAWAYCLADQVSISLIRVIGFENLQVINISTLNLFALTGRARMKFRVKVKKRTSRDSIGCIDP